MLNLPINTKFYWIKPGIFTAKYWWRGVYQGPDQVFENLFNNCCEQNKQENGRWSGLYIFFYGVYKTLYGKGLYAPVFSLETGVNNYLQFLFFHAFTHCYVPW